jgi:hypothetical protein
MSTPITSIAGLGRRGWAVAVPLLAAGALAAGCGTTHAGSAASGKASSGTGGTSPAVSAPAAAPVVTVTGGSTGAGQPDCLGWPASAPSVSLSMSFVPVSVERCVAGTTTVAGKGEWVTETLQRATTGLSGLVNSLRQHSAARTPGIACPALEIMPPQILLTDAAGQKVLPKVPRSGCGTVESRVLIQLNKLRWTPVSVRLVSQVPAAASTPTVVGSAPAVPVRGPTQSSSATS